MTETYCKHCNVKNRTRVHQVCEGCGFGMCPTEIADGVYLIDINNKICSERCKDFINKQTIC